MGETEVALSRERSAQEYHRILESNMEEFNRILLGHAVSINSDLAGIVVKSIEAPPIRKKAIPYARNQCYGPKSNKENHRQLIDSCLP